MLYLHRSFLARAFALGVHATVQSAMRIVDAIHDGSLKKVGFHTFEPNTFGLEIPDALDGVPTELLDPSVAWQDKAAFSREVRKLAAMFGKAFKLYEDDMVLAVLGVSYDVMSG